MGEIDVDASGTITELVPPGTPASDAGFDQDDRITRIDGKVLSGAVTFTAILAGHKVGDRIEITFAHPDGQSRSATVTLAENPALEAVPLETTGGALTAEQKAFRNAWLGTKSK